MNLQAQKEQTIKEIEDEIIMKLLTAAHPETHENINNAKAALEAKQITQEQYNDYIKELFRVEAERQILGKYPEVKG